jgi:hypothetical protein
MILAIDIGIKNLSLCCINSENKDLSTYKIHLWNVYDTINEQDHFCESNKKKGDLCNKKCLYKWTNNEKKTIYCCKTHFPKNLLPIKKENLFKKRLVNDYLLQDIAKIVLTKLQEIYDTNRNIFDQITTIIIELQPKINQKMKFISHIIYGKLVELYYNTKTTVRFVRAAHKLKAYTGPFLECKLKSPYAKRKWLSIQYIRWFFENKFSKDQKDMWLQHFENHTKKDDLSDTCLMAINGIYGIPKKQRTDKNGNCIK